MHYLIYLPGKSSNSLEQRLADAGLHDHADGATTQPVESGPDGSQGVLVAWLSTAAGNTRAEFRPDEQTWIKSVAMQGREAGAYWVGIWNEHPPKEGELRRAVTQQGKWTRFGPKGEWKFPTPTTVTHTFAWNDDGTARWVPLREFMWLVDEARQYREECLEYSSEKLARFEWDPSEWGHWVLKLLRVNYHLTPEIFVYLELPISDNLSEIVTDSLTLKIHEGAT